MSEVTHAMQFRDENGHYVLTLPTDATWHVEQSSLSSWELSIHYNREDVIESESTENTYSHNSGFSKDFNYPNGMSSYEDTAGVVDVDEMETITVESPFLDYLRDEYGESGTRSFVEPEQTAYQDEYDAALKKNNGLLPSGLANDIVHDLNVQIATTYARGEEDGAMTQPTMYVGLLDYRDE